MGKDFLKKYFQDLTRAITPQDTVLEKLLFAKEMFIATQKMNKKILVIGNGGSAAIASHVSVDLTKSAGIRAINFNEADLLTCFSNDFGYDHAYAKAIEYYGDKDDVLIAISSSGKSANILNAVEQARKTNFKCVITFSGMNTENPLFNSGDINFWVDSRAYNIIENTHQIWMLSLVDLIIGNSEYSA
jgi:D-sedoheptulose 7-phosphate isomerase